jgi:hypothetical protein
MGYLHYFKIKSYGNRQGDKDGTTIEIVASVAKSAYADFVSPAAVLTAVVSAGSNLVDLIMGDLSS